jgi:hypothetical protein
MPLTPLIPDPTPGTLALVEARGKLDEEQASEEKPTLVSPNHYPQVGDIA